VEVGDVKAPDGRSPRHVAGVAAHVLVAPGAERERAFAGEDDRADLGVLARTLERVGDFDERLRPEGVVHLGPVDRDLGDAARQLVADVLVFVAGVPLGRGADGARRRHRAGTIVLGLGAGIGSLAA
jgi:hypothetical protein